MTTRRMPAGLAVLLGLALTAGAADRTIERRLTDAEAAQRLAHVQENVASIKAAYERLRDEIDALACVVISVDNELCRLGETVRLNFEVRADHSPNPHLAITRDWLADRPEVEEVTLAWRADGPGRYVAEWATTPQRTGNYLVHWKCDIGGDIPEFWRNFSVIDNNWNVLIINTNANGAHPPETVLHELHLPSTLFSGHPLWQTPGNAHGFTDVSYDSRRYGDDWQVSCWLSNTWCHMLEEEDLKLYEEHPEVQRAVFAGYRDYMDMMRFWRGHDMIMVSSMSNEVAASMRAEGFRIFGGLYADQNWADGGDYRINHWGMPARPFFMARDDFRRCAVVGDVPVIGIQQCHRQSVLCRDYNCVFSLESGADYMMDRYSQYHRPRDITEIICSREYDLLRSFWDTRYERRNPMFFTCCLEFAGFDWMPEMWQIQPLFARYVAREVGRGGLAVASAHAVVDFYRRHFDDNPESALYLPDMWAGRVVTGYDRPKPPIYPDTMEMENGTFRAIARKGETLPYVFYDYEASWDYPYWGNADVPRKVGGYVVPNTEKRFEALPPIYDTRKLNYFVERHESSAATHIRLVVQAEEDRPYMALAVWDLPRAYPENPGDIELKGGQRFLPVAAPFTGNLNGFIIADLQQGRNVIELTVKSPPRPLQYQDLLLTDGVGAKVFSRDGQSLAYVYNIAGADVTVGLDIPAGAHVQLHPHALDSDEPVALAGQARFVVEPKKPLKLTGLDYAALKAAAPDARRFVVNVATPACDINPCGL